MNGPCELHWNLCFIAGYPEPGAVQRKGKDPEYRVVMAQQRSAALDSRLTWMAPMDVGQGSGMPWGIAR